MCNQPLQNVHQFYSSYLSGQEVPAGLEHQAWKVREELRFRDCFLEFLGHHKSDILRQILVRNVVL